MFIYIILILLIIIMLPSYKNIEYMTATELGVDIGAINTLSRLANSLTTGGSLTVPGGLTIMGEINTIGNVYTPILSFIGGPNQPVWSNSALIQNISTPVIGQQITISNNLTQINLTNPLAPSGTRVILSVMVKLGTATNFVIHFTDMLAWATIFDGYAKEYKNELNSNTFTEIKHKITIPLSGSLNILIGSHDNRPNITKQSNGTLFTYGWKYYYDTQTSK